VYHPLLARSSCHQNVWDCCPLLHRPWDAPPFVCLLLPHSILLSCQLAARFGRCLWWASLWQRVRRVACWWAPGGGRPGAAAPGVRLFLGHTRFATSSIPSVRESHPHQVTPPTGLTPAPCSHSLAHVRVCTRSPFSASYHLRARTTSKRPVESSNSAEITDCLAKFEHIRKHGPIVGRLVFEFVELPACHTYVRLCK
jgi:hypothetical protein